MSQKSWREPEGYGLELIVPAASGKIRRADQRKKEMTSIEREVLDRFKASLAEQLDVSEIILFGSRARGDADVFSDMDVIVVLVGTADDRSRDFVSDCAWESGLESGIVLVPIVFSQTEWETGVARSSLLGKAVAQEGHPV